MRPWRWLVAMVLVFAWVMPQAAWAFAHVDTCTEHCDDDLGDEPCPPFSGCCSCAARSATPAAQLAPALSAPLWTDAPRVAVVMPAEPPAAPLEHLFRPPRSAT